ncbi:MAG: sugar-binding domain-containing protein [Bacteroidota bacterium]
MTDHNLRFNLRGLSLLCLISFGIGHCHGQILTVPASFDQIHWMPPHSFSNRVDDLDFDPGRVLDISDLWNFAFIPFTNNFPLSTSTIQRKTLTWRQSSLPEEWQWQMTYDLPQFGNVSLSSKSVIGLYRKQFNLPLEWENHPIFVRLEGKGYQISLSINGNEVRSFFPDNSAVEFEVSPYLQPGKNQFTIQVHHLPSRTDAPEDSWLASGLTSVRLLREKDARLKLLGVKQENPNSLAIQGFIQQLKEEFGKTQFLEVQLVDQKKGVIYELDKKYKVSKKATPVFFSIPLKDITSWSPYTKQTYLLKFWLRTSKNDRGTHYQKEIGFSRRKINNGKCWINDQYIPIRGTQYRHYLPGKGHCLPKTTLKKDLQLLKSLHINTLLIDRAFDPTFYQVCMQEGFMLVSKWNKAPDLRRESDKKRILLETLYPNLAFYLSPPTQAQAFPKEIPHLTYAELEKIGTYKKPTFSFGDAREDFKGLNGKIQPISIVGAFSDQALLVPLANGQFKMAYDAKVNGQHISQLESLNGIVEADRTPQPEASFLKKAYEPVKLALKPKNILIKHPFPNEIDFPLYLEWELQTVDSTYLGKRKMDHIPENLWSGIPYPFDLPENYAVRLAVSSPSLGELGSLTAHDGKVPFGYKEKNKSSRFLKVEESLIGFQIRTAGFHYHFDKGINMLDHIAFNGKDYLKNPARFRIGKLIDPNLKLKRMQSRNRIASSMMIPEIQFYSIEGGYLHRSAYQIIYQGQLSLKEYGRLPFSMTYTVHSNGELETDFEFQDKDVKDPMLTIEHLIPWNIQEGVVQEKEGESPKDPFPLDKQQFPFLVPLYPQLVIPQGSIGVKERKEDQQLIIDLDTPLPISMTQNDPKSLFKARYLEELNRLDHCLIGFGPILIKQDSKEGRIRYRLRMEGKKEPKGSSK